MAKLTHGSLFSGVGGIDIGFDAAGIRTLWQCEIDKRCRSVLARHWPNAKRYEDVTKVDGAKLKPVDIITFGSPCQDLSVAGKRAGLDGARSGLFFEAIRIIKEMQDATNGQHPKLAIWENVRGALSSNGGADFRAAVEALADLGAAVAWRVVDTGSSFGPPQRRTRVFVVADLTGERAGQILAQPARVCWHPPTSAATGSNAPGDAGDGAAIGGWRAARDIVSTVLKDSGGICVPEAQAGQLVYMGDKSVRRLTPVECERLMGWPDDHTALADDGTPISDSARYKMCGNGVTGAVAQWLGENIVATLLRARSGRARSQA